MKLTISGLGGAVPVVRHFLLICLPFAITLFQVMLPRKQMQTDYFLRTGLPLCHPLFHILWLVLQARSASSHLTIAASARYPGLTKNQQLGAFSYLPTKIGCLAGVQSLI